MGGNDPCEDSASSLYRRLFLQGSEEAVNHQISRLQLGQSIMDSVADDADGLKRQLGKNDRERLDQYMTGVRELEKRMALSSEWERKPKPKATGSEPKDPDSNRAYMEKTRLMYDMSRMAFETDSTRLITIFLDSVNSPAIDVEGINITDGYHNLSHHGQDPTKLAELTAIDMRHMKLLAGLLTKLKGTQESGVSLLDRTWCFSGAISETPTSTLPIICLCCLLAEDSSTVNISHLIRIGTIRYRIYSSACCNGWTLRQIISPRRLVRCVGSSSRAKAALQFSPIGQKSFIGFDLFRRD